MGAIVMLAVAAAVFSGFAYLATLKVLGFLRWRHVYSADVRHVDAIAALGTKVSDLQARVGRIEMRKGL